MCASYKTVTDVLKKVYSVSVGQVVDVNDTAQIAVEMMESENPFGEDFRQKLQHISAQDVPRLVDEVLDYARARAAYHTAAFESGKYDR